MAPNDSQSPKSPKSPKSPLQRKSIVGFFQDMDISDDKTPLESKGKVNIEPSAIVSLFSHSSASPRSKGSLLRRTFRKGWPPTLRKTLFTKELAQDKDAPSPQDPSRTLKMSDLYRIHGDNWAYTQAKDEPSDMSAEFSDASKLMDEVHHLCKLLEGSGDMVADEMINSMAEVVYGSNYKARKGLGLDETLKICMAIFNGEEDVEYCERTEEYQAKLEAMIRKNLDFLDEHKIRSRREVIQHAAAFQHIVDMFVRRNKPINEELIKETHEILVRGIGGEDAGFISSKDFGGIYRIQDVYVGTHRFPTPAHIPEAMKSMVNNLARELEESETNSQLDPFALAAKYCDRFVNIHPFRDGNGRMCRLIMNAITIKYAGVVVGVGEHDQSRDEYIDIARESRDVGGHAGPLATLVLKESKKSYKKLIDRLRGGGARD